ncbi:hypothetical protein OSB04_un000917 [Centaurea solstitialis]|uniref:Reverse transcriptase zinc-binding domain-containing protein n=1 Tax=Centaurea solstitialis TaxID=347529 RepID=A0AA38S4Z9_9ASTR|nr:hypothetical protein OSB04_un000917 [Centaurea solstitialis]
MYVFHKRAQLVSALPVSASAVVDSDAVNGYFLYGLPLVNSSCFGLGLHLRKRFLRAVPKTVNIFMWRLRLGRLPTCVVLDKMGVDLDSHLCPRCGEEVESIPHAFFTCDKMKLLWELIGRNSWKQDNKEGLMRKGRKDGERRYGVYFTEQNGVREGKFGNRDNFLRATNKSVLVAIVKGQQPEDRFGSLVMRPIRRLTKLRNKWISENRSAWATRIGLTRSHDNSLVSHDPKSISLNKDYMEFNGRFKREAHACQFKRTQGAISTTHLAVPEAGRQAVHLLPNVITGLSQFVLAGISNMVYSDFESPSTLLPQAHFDLIDDTIIMAQFVNIKTLYRRYDYNSASLFERYHRPYWAQTNPRQFWAEARLLKHAARGRSPRTSRMRPPGLELRCCYLLPNQVYFGGDTLTPGPIGPTPLYLHEHAPGNPLSRSPAVDEIFASRRIARVAFGTQTGWDRTGRDRTGQYRTGQESRTGLDGTGLDRTEQVSVLCLVRLGLDWTELDKFHS